MLPFPLLGTSLFPPTSCTLNSHPVIRDRCAREQQEALPQILPRQKGTNLNQSPSRYVFGACARLSLRGISYPKGFTK